MSGRSRCASCSKLCSERSTWLATASTSSSVDDNRLARKSGSKLNVVCPSGQYHRAMNVPGGSTRSYGVCRAKWQPPFGCSGQRSKFALSQAFCSTYC